MKKIVLLFSVLVLAFTSCEGPMGPPGTPGEGMNWEIINFTVQAQDWRLVGQPNALGSYYMYEFQANQITNFICEEGNVFGYRWLSNNEQTPLGQVAVMGEDLGNGQEVLFTEVYSFSFRPGYVTFFIDYSDFATDIRPMTCDFRIVLNY
ncbi:MAG: hypothetical protein LBE56_03340 [Tannerella sp.]|jgi:hypothetical protein|nr:hypothetical protein [Tannerella sp.]